jgi:hypothetical protein
MIRDSSARRRLAGTNWTIGLSQRLRSTATAYHAPGSGLAGSNCQQSRSRSGDGGAATQYEVAIPLWPGEISHGRSSPPPARCESTVSSLLGLPAVRSDWHTRRPLATTGKVRQMQAHACPPQPSHLVLRWHPTVLLRGRTGKSRWKVSRPRLVLGTSRHFASRRPAGKQRLCWSYVRSVCGEFPTGPSHLPLPLVQVRKNPGGCKCSQPPDSCPCSVSCRSCVTRAMAVTDSELRGLGVP